MDLELRSIGLLSAGIFLILAIVLSLMLRQSRRVRGSRGWLLGTGLLTIGMALRSAHPWLPIPITFIVGNIAMIVGALWLALGTYEYRYHKAPSRWVLPVVALIVGAYFSWFTLVDWSDQARVAAYSLVTAAITAWHAWLMFYRKNAPSREMSSGHWLATIGQLGAAACFGVRGMQALASSENVSIFSTFLAANQALVVLAALFGALNFMGLILILVHELEAELRSLAGKDPLTGALNRRGLVEALAALPAGTPYSLIMLDIDHFKHINDDFGHAHGDAVITLAVRIAHAHAPPTMLLARLGGDEFCVVLPSVDAATAQDIACAIGQTFREQSMQLGHARSHTLSIGVSACEAGTPDLSHMMKLADQALYYVKQTGRNGVRLAA
ncbi:MAG: diguanylate cyclase [Burkholderiaceae bacterium]